MSATHHLKVRAPFWHALKAGAKTFELRRNDRDFHCGDTLVLEELDEHGEKTGYTLERRVSHILHTFSDKGDQAIADGFCVMSLAAPTPNKRVEELVVEAALTGDRFGRGQIISWLQKNGYEDAAETVASNSTATRNAPFIRALLSKTEGE